MISKIRICNFRSLIDEDVQLKPLTVIVGSNGSGKSNLIKSLDFLSSVPNRGLAEAINRSYGIDNIVPKAIPAESVKNTLVTFSYEHELLPNLSSQGRLPPITVNHSISFKGDRKNVVRVMSEKLLFKGVLALSKWLNLENPQINAEDAESTVTLTLGDRGAQLLDTTPDIDSTNVALFLDWFGLSEFREIIVSKRKLLQLLHKESKPGELESSVPKSRRYMSFLDPQIPSKIDKSAHARVFKTRLRSIRRYDLLLNNLRNDQQTSDMQRLASDGSNMPSIVRMLLSDPEKRASLNRIIDTLHDISPNTKSFSRKLLKTGKEFIEFKEISSGRGVESWESSDGTLRALAILLALETQPKNTTVLIEEPEQNLHPWAIKSIIDHTRSVIEANKLQVIYTTHSQQVLEQLNPDELLVATRTSNVGTKLYTLEDLLPGSKILMGQIGDMWVDGLLGGVPTYE